ncbi:Ndr [Aphelenchoides avenae]|nr:Ndr [Aphelenchus avenae]
MQKLTVHGKYCEFNVYIQGDLQERHEKTFIVTVHDAGTDHLSFVRFADHPSMGDAKQRAIFLHVCVPGQENKAPDYNEDFPSLQELGEDLVCVLDKCDVRTCVALGEGAGAVIVCRFAAAWPTRIMGMILLRCTSVMTEVSDFSRDQRDEDLRPKLEDGVMTESAWQYYSMHKYGQPASWNQPSMEELKGTLNLKNFSKYLYSLSTCTEWSTVIGPKLDT